MRGFPVTLFVLAALGSAGCGGPEVNTVSFQHQTIQAVSFDSAFAAAESAVGERFRISERNPRTGTIRGVAHETSVDATWEPGERRLVPVRARRSATVRVREGDGRVDIYCRVQVQENTADTARMLKRENTVFDQPHDTPADRDAGISREQSAVWRNRRRDRAMEREVFASVVEILGGSAGGP